MTDKQLTEEQQIEHDKCIELKQFALGIGMKPTVDFSPNAGSVKLQEAIDKFVQKLKEDAEASVVAIKEEAKLKAENPLPANLPLTPNVNETEREKSARLTKEANRLVRVKVTNLNPDKQEWSGEILTFRNAIVGTIRKFVPFGTDEPFHVPQVLVNIMKERKFTKFVSKRDHMNREYKKGVQLNEFNVEEFPPLTEREWEDLRRTVAMRQGGDGE